MQNNKNFGLSHSLIQAVRELVKHESKAGGKDAKKPPFGKKSSKDDKDKKSSKGDKKLPLGKKPDENGVDDANFLPSGKKDAKKPPKKEVNPEIKPTGKQEPVKIRPNLREAIHATIDTINRLKAADVMESFKVVKIHNPDSPHHGKFGQLRVAKPDADGHVHVAFKSFAGGQKLFTQVRVPAKHVHYKGKPLSEHTLDELSDMTLSSYRKKAAKDRDDKVDKALDLQAGDKKRQKLADKAWKRQAGYDKAGEKLKEDSEQIDELSKTTLKSYMDKNAHREKTFADRSAMADQKGKRKEAAKYFKKSLNSWEGQQSAKERLAGKFRVTAQNREPNARTVFKPYRAEEVEYIDETKDPCWKGYEAIGMKMKNGKKVPNCVPKNEEKEEPPFTPDKKKVNWKASPQSRAKWLAKHMAKKKATNK